MGNKQITANDIANGLIDLSENMGLCDKEIAKGVKDSKKKEILKSNKEKSFSKFTGEIIKSQNRKK